MPKKTRKAKMRASQRATPSGYAPAPRTVEATDEEFTTPAAPVMTRTAAPAPARASAPAPAAGRGSVPITLDYHYVFSDLRRIAILAGFFFLLMFVLYFLIEVQHIPIIPGIG